MRRLEDRIRSLCARAIQTEGEEELRPLLNELRAALRDHVERIRKRFGDYPAAIERRVNGEMADLKDVPAEASIPRHSPTEIKPSEMDSIKSKTKKAPNGPANGTTGL